MSQYYGQFDPPTDQLIEEYFPKDYMGHAVDVGAVDGIFMSNTLYFEHKGWDVIAVEANPRFAFPLQWNRKRPIIAAVASTDREQTEFTEVEMIGPGMYSSMSGLEVDKNLVDKHVGMGFRMNYNKVQVTTRTLDSLVMEWNPPKIDLVSIDIEGTEIDALKGFDINKWQPKLFVIEANDDDHSSRIQEYMKQFEYQLDRRHAVNDFYVKA